MTLARLGIVVVAALALLGAGCSGRGASGASAAGKDTTTIPTTTTSTVPFVRGGPQNYVDDLADALAASPGIPLDATTAACLAHAVVDHIDTAVLHGEGIDPSDLSQGVPVPQISSLVRAQRAAIVDAATACHPGAALAASAAKVLGIEPTAVPCLASGADDGRVVTGYVDFLTGSTAFAIGSDIGAEALREEDPACLKQVLAAAVLAAKGAPASAASCLAQHLSDENARAVIDAVGVDLVLAAVPSVRDAIAAC